MILNKNLNKSRLYKSSSVLLIVDQKAAQCKAPYSILYIQCVLALFKENKVLLVYNIVLFFT